MKDDELISRKVLLAEFRSLCGPETGDGWDNLGVRALIMRQPRVDAAPVIHAKWEPSEVHHGFLCCSNCRNAFVEPEWLNGSKWKYCPTCGAKMDGGRA